MWQGTSGKTHRLRLGMRKDCTGKIAQFRLSPFFQGVPFFPNVAGYFRQDTSVAPRHEEGLYRKNRSVQAVPFFKAVPFFRLSPFFPFFPFFHPAVSGAALPPSDATVVRETVPGSSCSTTNSLFAFPDSGPDAAVRP